MTLESSSSPTNNKTNNEEDEKHEQQEKWLLERIPNNLSTKTDLTSLVKLNLPNLGLSTLPSELPKILPNLSILFLSKNNFIELPQIVGQCPNLQMISFKENYGMKTIHPESLQPQLRWLILTGNSLTQIPETIGRCNKLQKLMLSGNQLTTLPDSIDKLINLELIRLACNQLSEPPIKLLQLPKLRWVALSNNPFLDDVTTSSDDDDNIGLAIIDDPLLEDDKWPILGQGAGGITREVTWDNDNNQKVAVKTYSGEITSDGSPQDERTISVMAASLNDPCLIKLMGQTFKSRSLVMEYLNGYHALAGPPSLDTCTRDVYYNNDNDNDNDNDDSTHLLMDENFCWQIATNMLRVLYKLHQMGICHGDFYAHNILISSSSNNDDESTTTGNGNGINNKNKVKLSDFGAAFLYEPNSMWGKYIPKIELRSYAVLVEELYQYQRQQLVVNKTSSSSNNDDDDVNQRAAQQHVSSNHPWVKLMEACQQKDTTFESLAKQFHVGI